MRGRQGFSLLELLVVITIFALVLAAAGRLMVSTQRAFVTQREAAQVMAPLRQAENVLTELLRGAGANPNKITTVASGRRLPGIYALTQSGRSAYYRIVADLTPPFGTSLDEEFEDVQTWVESDTLWVSWRNQAGTAAAKQAVATPITAVTYTFVDAAGTAVAPSGTNSQIVGAARAQVTITSVRPDQPSIPIRRQAWVPLRN